MIRFFLLFCIAFLPSNLCAQDNNLVPNPGFEERDTCIYNTGEVYQAPYWFNPTEASPDLFHECAVTNEEPCPYPESAYLDLWLVGIPTNFAGCQAPHSGVGYAGASFYGPASSEYREYLAVPLEQPLESGTQYYVSYFVSLAERSSYAVWALQAFLGPDSITSGSFAHLQFPNALNREEGDYISDKQSWQAVSWQYTAQGGERYLYIGNFQSNEVIDTLALELTGDIESNYPASYYYVDDVYVGTENPLGVNTPGKSKPLKVWPNPATGVLHLEHSEKIKTASFVSTTGKQVAQYTVQGVQQIDISGLSPGIYILQLQMQQGGIIARKVIKADQERGF